MAVDPAVALLKSRRVPRDLEVHQQPGRVLEVQAFGCGIGGNQDLHWRIRVIERELDAFAVFIVHAAVELDDGAAVGTEFPLQALHDVVQGRLVFGEDDQPFVAVPCFGVAKALLDQVLQAVEAGVDRWHLVDDG